MSVVLLYFIIGLMGPKKKVQDDDDSTQKLIRIYRRKLQDLGLQMSNKSLLKEKIEQAMEGDNPHLKKLIFYEEVGAKGTQAIFQTFMEQGGYKHLQILVMSNVKTYDEGLKYLCKYMQMTKTIKQLELQINQIGPLGCEYLGLALSPAQQVPILKLNLSYNKFGSEGLKNLSKGLCQNQFLEQLILNYCEIDYQGAMYIQDILSFVDSKLESLSLIGNQLRNEGVYQLFRALIPNQALSELLLTNNQFGESETIPVIDMIVNVLSQNTTLVYVNLDGNGLYNDSASKFLKVMQDGHNHQLLIQFGVLANKQIMDEFKKILKKRKKKKKKKKKKKGKKKGKK